MAPNSNQADAELSKPLASEADNGTRTMSGQAPQKKKTTFKLAATLVMAAKRFQAALNPTLPIGTHKRPGSPSLQQMPSKGSRDHTGRSTSGRTMSGRAENAGKQYGHKGSLLFKPLPPLEQELEQEAVA